MMRRTLLLGGLAVVAGTGWALLQGIFATKDVAMTYEDFRTRAMADLAHEADDLITFTPATKPFFQDVRSNAPAYLPLMMRLVDDPTVPVAVKFGASAAMLDLPVVDLTAYLAHLLEAAQHQPGLIDTAEAVAMNHYRGSSFLAPGQVADWALIDYANRVSVAAVLPRLWEAPDLPDWARAQGTPLHDLFATR